MFKPTADPGAESLSWEGGSRGGWQLRCTTLSLHCLSYSGLYTLILFWELHFCASQIAEVQQPGEKQLSIIFCWQLISDDFQLFILLLSALLDTYSHCVVFSLGFFRRCNWSGLQMQASEKSTTRSCMNCCSSTITLVRSLWFGC